MTFIAIICGLKSEAATVRKAVGAANIRIAISGADASRAEHLARNACQEGAAVIVSIGISGGLDPALMSGDLVIGSDVIDDDTERYSADFYLLNVLKKNMRDGTLVGPLFGADAIIDSAAKKSALFANHGAIAVDMESHGAARAAREFGVPFLAIRAIADPADRALPAAALGAIAPDGSTQVLKTLGAALRDPSQFPALMKLGADSAAATKTLRRDLGPLFRRLFLSLDL